MHFYRTITLLSVLFTVECAYGQITPIPTKEVYSDCDLEVLKSDPKNGKCNAAIPPLNSGDCLSSQHYCINKKYATVHLIAYPNLARILDKDSNKVVVQGEPFTLSALIFAKDKNTLQQVLDNTKVQFLNGSTWVTRATLHTTDYGPLSNIRTYRFSDCGQTLAKFSASFEKAERLYFLAHTGLSRNRPSNAPRPAPDSYLKSIPSDPRSPTGGLPPPPPGSDERFYNEMADAAMKQAVKDLEAVNRPGSCEPKTLPYFWTGVHVRLFSELNDTQMRLFVDSTLTGTRVLELPDRFKTYPAASTPVNVPTGDGGRSFSFNIIASGELNISGGNATPTLVYDENALSTIRRAGVDVATIGESTIDGRTVKAWSAKGRMPFKKKYFDDGTRAEVSQTTARQGDVNAVAIKPGANVAYRVEISFAAGSSAFVSRSANFTMPPPLTFALMGDSFSAGEGAPDLAAAKPWMNEVIGGLDSGENCHRTRNSGLYRAMNRFIKESNRACDYVFVACSGAVIQDLMSQPQPSKRNDDGVTRKNTITGPAPLCQLKSQIDMVRDWRVGKGYARVNTALFGIGGNNAGFAKVIGDGITGLVLSDDVKAKVDSGLSFIGGPNGYEALDSALKTRLGVQNVIILGYPDVVHGANGTVCLTDCSPQGSINTINADDLAYGAELTSRLNGAVQAADSLPGWSYADIFDATRDNGICACNDMFFNTWTAATGLRLGVFVSGVELVTPLRGPCSKGNQALAFGASCSFHPSERGYREYVTPILRQLNALYGN